MVAIHNWHVEIHKDQLIAPILAHAIPAGVLPQLNLVNVHIKSFFSVAGQLRSGLELSFDDHLQGVQVKHVIIYNQNWGSSARACI